MTSRKSSRRLPASSGDVSDRPVTLPPGRARLATRPVLRGSATVANTIGITEVAGFAAKTGGPAVTITSTLRRANSAAISAKRSKRPSAQRISITTVRPSIHPSSRSRCSKAATHWPAAARVCPLRNPMVGSLPDCCARAASGHANAPPRRVMKSRRFMGSPPQGGGRTLPHRCTRTRKSSDRAKVFRCAHSNGRSSARLARRFSATSGHGRETARTCLATIRR